MQGPRWSILLEAATLKFFLVFGILPLAFDGSAGKFSNGKYVFVYSVSVTVSVAIGLPVICIMVYQRNHDPSQKINNFLMAIQFTAIYTFLVVIKCMLIWKSKTLLRLLNEVYALRSALQKMVAHTSEDSRSFTFFLLKLYAVDIVLLLASLIIFRCTDSVSTTSVQQLGLFVFSFMIGLITMLQNVFLLVLMVSDTIQSMINRAIRSTASTMRDPKHEDVDHSVHVVRHMYMLHCSNMSVKGEFMALMNLPVLMLNFWYFFMIIYSGFFMYVSVLKGLKQGTTMEVLKIYLNPTIFLVFQFSQLYNLVLVPSMVTDRAKQMLGLLSGINHHHRLQQRMDRLLEVLMIDSLGRNYDISNYGLYAINRGLLFGMITTITSYLIILVQFQMQNVD